MTLIWLDPTLKSTSGPLRRRADIMAFPKSEALHPAGFHGPGGWRGGAESGVGEAGGIVGLKNRKRFYG